MEYKKSWLCRIGWHRWVGIDPFKRICMRALCEKVQVFNLVYEAWLDD